MPISRGLPPRVDEPGQSVRAASHPRCASRRGPQPESLAATVAELQRKHGRRRLMEMLSCLEVHPVFTAHPTEARRRAVVTAIRRVGEQLNRLEDPRSSDAERREAMRRLTEEID